MRLHPEGRARQPQLVLLEALRPTPVGRPGDPAPHGGNIREPMGGIPWAAKQQADTMVVSLRRRGRLAPTASTETR